MAIPGADVPFLHRQKITRYVYIPTRDGARLAADIYRPEGEGRWPCLLMQTPYNRNSFDPATAARYVGAGYVLCVVDVRGTGGSEGELAYYNIPLSEGGSAAGPQEFAGPYDGADCVEWLASRDFCDGKVGTFGGSALGVAQLLTARGKPEHLGAMFVERAPVNYYLDRWFPGGIHNLDATVSWQDSMTENISPARAVEDVSGLPGEVDPEGERIRRRVRLERLRRRARASSEGRWTKLLERFLVLRNTTEFGGIWRQYYHAPFLASCEVPTHYTGVWYDHFVRGSCESYVAHAGPGKLTVQPGGQGLHGAHSDVDVVAEHIRWFDHWLKGADNGVMDEPPVRLFVMGLEEWRGFAEWPPAEAKATTFELSSDSALRRSGARPNAGGFEDVLRHDPDDPLVHVDGDVADVRGYSERALTYTTEPLAEDLTVIGEPKLRLRVRCTAADGHLFVKLCDVFPDGRSRQVTNGRLRLAHRDGHDRVAPLPAGEAVPVEIVLWPVANTFRAGHSVQLVLGGSETPVAEVFPEPCEITIVSGGDAPAALELPVVG